MRSHNTLLTLLLSSQVALAAVEWRPVEQFELKLKTPKIDPAADAEAIFWDIRIEDRLQGVDLSLVMSHYVRIKIFTERGKEKFATVEIPRFGKRSIADVAARTIKPDGSVIELKKDSIFDRELVKTKGLRLRGKTFALPNVEVGDIVEYRYREIRDNEVASHMRLYFQRDVPMWDVTYHLKPLTLPWLPYGMRTMAFQCQMPGFRKEPDNFYAASMHDVPAFKDEPYMPPEDQLRSWMLIYYEEDRKINPDKFWKDVGKQDFAQYKPLMKADDLVKRTSAEVVSGASKPAEQLTALDAFCRSKVKNIYSGAFETTAEERKSVKENHSPSDTLKQMAGRPLDIDLLFAAMANAAGFDARIARVADRGDVFFSPRLPTKYFLQTISVAVNVDGKWAFFDPSTPFLEPGMLRWQEEGTVALISDPKEGVFSATSNSPPSRSKRYRRAEFKLLDDGTLEGDVRYTYSGHIAHAQKQEYVNMTPAQQEEDWKRSLQARLSTAELSSFIASGLREPAKPVVIAHRVSIPGYATRTAKRILLQPSFFQRNIGFGFSENSRQWDVYFPFGWSEDDEVTIELPEGWVLDKPLRPGSSKLGDIGDYTVELRKTLDGRKLIYRRRFDWGRDGKLLFPVASYPQLKKTFDALQEGDAYVLTLVPDKAATNGN